MDKQVDSNVDFVYLLDLVPIYLTITNCINYICIYWYNIHEGIKYISW